jgi:uncharacterized protein (DUF58 family)
VSESGRPRIAGRTKVRLTGAGSWTLVGALLSLALGWLTGDSWLLVAGAGAIGLITTSVLLVPRYRSSVRFCHRMSERSVVGSSCEHTLHLHNNSRRSTRPLRMKTIGALPGDVIVDVPAVAAGDLATSTVYSTPTRRGHHSGAVVSVTGTDPCGLVSGTWRLRGPSPTVVHPAPIPVVLPPFRASSSESVRRRGGPDGEDFFELRAWHPGDSRRHTNWRASARRQQLVVTDRELPDGNRIVLIVAGHPRGHDGEAMVSIAASTAVEALRRGAQVMLLSGSDTTAIQLNSTTEILDWFAAFNPVRKLGSSEAEALIHALRQLPGTQCWIASAGRVPTEWTDTLLAGLDHERREHSLLAVPARSRVAP